jgi:hypothetical protein
MTCARTRGFLVRRAGGPATCTAGRLCAGRHCSRATPLQGPRTCKPPIRHLRACPLLASHLSTHALPPESSLTTHTCTNHHHLSRQTTLRIGTMRRSTPLRIPPLSHPTTPTHLVSQLKAPPTHPSTLPHPPSPHPHPHPHPQPLTSRSSSRVPKPPGMATNASACRAIIAWCGRRGVGRGHEGRMLRAVVNHSGCCADACSRP